MEFKWSIIFGIILAIIMQAVAAVVFMSMGQTYLVDGVITYISAAIIPVIIIFTLIFTKLYLGKVSTTLGGMFVTSIIWIIIIAIIDVIMVFVYGLDLVTYYSNYWIYIGDVLLIIFAIIGFKLFGSKGGGATAAAPAKTKPAPAESPPEQAPATPTA